MTTQANSANSHDGTVHESHTKRANLSQAAPPVTFHAVTRAHERAMSAALRASQRSITAGRSLASVYEQATERAAKAKSDGAWYRLELLARYAWELHVA